jgi:hypothetical protein
VIKGSAVTMQSETKTRKEMENVQRMTIDRDEVSDSLTAAMADGAACVVLTGIQEDTVAITTTAEGCTRIDRLPLHHKFHIPGLHPSSHRLCYPWAKLSTVSFHLSKSLLHS